MALTVNNLNTLHLLNILNQTQARQDAVFNRMATGYKINTGADDPAGLLALTSLQSELTAVDAGISSNQRTDALLGVTEGALAEVSNLVGEIQRLANESANDAGLTADEIAANQAQIDDALSSIDRIVGTTQFNGTKLLDGSLSIKTTYDSSKLTDVKVFSRNSSTTDTSLTVELVTIASAAGVVDFVTTSATATTSFAVQGKDGTAVIEVNIGEDLDAIAAKINAATAQTGVTASAHGAHLDLISSEKGTDAFVRTSLIEGDSNFGANNVSGVDAVVTVNGQATAVDGDHVAYSGNGISVSFTNAMTTPGTDTLTIKGSATPGGSGATFQLGTNSSTRATIGIDGLYSQQLGDSSAGGYLASLKSGGSNSLLNDPAAAAQIARAASSQVSTVRGRIGGFQKFQVRTSINSLNGTKEGLEKARSVIRDVDYAAESAELNRQNILMQSALSLLGIANQQSASVLSLLR